MKTVKENEGSRFFYAQEIIRSMVRCPEIWDGYGTEEEIRRFFKSKQEEIRDVVEVNIINRRIGHV